MKFDLKHILPAKISDDDPASHKDESDRMSFYRNIVDGMLSNNENADYALKTDDVSGTGSTNRKN